VQWPAIQVAAFDQQVRERASCAQLPQLRPQPTLQNGRVQVEDALALDQCFGTDGVVTGRKRRS